MAQWKCHRSVCNDDDQQYRVVRKRTLLNKSSLMKTAIRTYIGNEREKSHRQSRHPSSITSIVVGCERYLKNAIDVDLDDR